MGLFSNGTRVFIALGAGTVPGVCVGTEERSEYVNRRGQRVPTTEIMVLSRRELPGRPAWTQLSRERTTLLSLRDVVVEGLDVDEHGQPISMPQLFALQRESLQSYLAARQAARPGTTNSPSATA